MRKSLPLVGLLGFLALASCVSEYRRGRDDYYEGLYRLSSDPDEARALFKESDEHFQAAISEEELSPRMRVTAISYRIRAAIELDKHADAVALASAPVEGYNRDQAYDGDPVGLSLLRSRVLDADRAYAELLVADRKANTLKSRLHVAWEQVHALEKMGTPKSKAEAVKICEQHAGKLDFDELKKRLAN